MKAFRFVVAALLLSATLVAGVALTAVTSDTADARCRTQTQNDPC
jgi:hypothetical protein